MAISHTPGLLVQKSGRAVGTALTRVYVVEDGTDPDTGGPRYVFDSAGPNEAVLAYNSGTQALTIDSDTGAASKVNTVLDASRHLVLYT